MVVKSVNFVGRYLCLFKSVNEGRNTTLELNGLGFLSLLGSLSNVPGLICYCSSPDSPRTGENLFSEKSDRTSFY